MATPLQTVFLLLIFALQPLARAATQGTPDACRNELLAVAEESTPQFHSLDHLSPHARAQWTQALELGGARLRKALLALAIIKKGLGHVYADYRQSGYLGPGDLPADRDPRLGLERQLVYLQSRLRATRGQIVDGEPILAEDVIEPGFLFMNGAGKTVVLPYAAEMDGATHLLTMPPVDDILLKDTAYTGFLASGYQIVQVQQQEANFAVVQHDLAHLSGFLRDPAYMRAVRREATRRHAAGPARKLIASDAQERRGLVTFYIFESLSRGSLPALRTLFERLGVPEALECQTPKCLKKLLEPRHERLVELYNEMSEDLIVTLGGALVGGQRISLADHWSDLWDPVAIELSPRELREQKLEDLIYYLLITAKISVGEQVRQLTDGPSAYLCAAYEPYLRDAPAAVRRVFCP